MLEAYITVIDRANATAKETHRFCLDKAFGKMKAIECFFSMSAKHTVGKMPTQAWAMHLERGYTQTETTKVTYMEVESRYTRSHDIFRHYKESATLLEEASNAYD